MLQIVEIRITTQPGYKVMAKVEMKRDRQEDFGTPADAPENIIYVQPKRETDPVKKDRAGPGNAAEAESAPEVIDAEWVEAGEEQTAPKPAAGHSARMAKSKPPEFTFVNYVLLFFSAALLSALVMLAILGQV